MKAEYKKHIWGAVFVLFTACFHHNAEARSVLLPKKSFCETGANASDEGEIAYGLLSPDGRTVLTIGDVEQGMQLWSIDGAMLNSSALQRSSGSAAFFPDSERLAASHWVDVKFASEGYTAAVATASVWGLDQNQFSTWQLPPQEQISPDAAVTVFAVSPDNDTIAVAGLDDEAEQGVALYDAQWRQKFFIATDGTPETVLFSPDGHRILIAENRPDEPAGVHLYATRDGRRLSDFDGSKAVASAAFAPDGRSVILGLYEDDLLWFDIDGNFLHRFDFNGVEYEGMTFTPDGQKLLVKNGNDLYLWDLASLKIEKTLPLADRERGRGLTYTPDGNFVLAGCELYEIGAQSMLLQVQESAPQAAAPAKASSSRRQPGAQTIENHQSDRSTLYYYDGFPAISIGSVFDGGEQCSGAVNAIEHSKREIKITIVTPPDENEDYGYGYPYSGEFTAELNSRGEFGDGEELQGVLHSDGRVEGFVVFQGKRYQFNKENPRRIERQHLCEHTKIPSSDPNADDWHAPTLEVTANSLPAIDFARKQMASDQAELKRQFDKQDVSGVFGHIEQNIVYAEGDLLSLCSELSITYRGSSFENQQKNCRIYYAGKEVMPEELFFDLAQKDFERTGLYRLFASLIPKLIAIPLDEGSKIFTRRPDNFYADHDGIVFVFDTQELPAQDRASGRAALKFRYRELGSLIDLSLIGK